EILSASLPKRVRRNGPSTYFGRRDLPSHSQRGFAMSMRSKVQLGGLVLGGCLVCGLFGHAEPAKTKVPPEERATPLDSERPPAPAIPADLRDPAFERYVDVAQVGEALAAGNPGLLTDVAMQLAEGERVLQRPHKALSAARVLKLAMRLAVEKKDKPALDRLAKVVKASGDKELKAWFTKAQTLGAGSPKPATGWLEAVERLDSESFLMLKSYLD